MREPPGVVGAIIPRNSPLQPDAMKISMALRMGAARLIHKPAAEARRLEVMTASGLIYSADGIIDGHVVGIRDSTHIAVAEMAEAIIRKALT